LVLFCQVIFQERRNILPGVALGCIALGVVGSQRVGHWENDLSLFEASHQRAAEDPNVRLNLARTVVNDEPLRALDLLRDVEPDGERRKREAASVRGRALLLLARPGEAIDWLRKAVAAEPESAWAVGTLCVLRSGKADAEALDVCLLAVELLPEDADVANAMGVVFGQRKEVEAAVRWFSVASALDPQRGLFKANLRAAESALDAQ